MVDKGDWTITDKLSGLMWQKQVDETPRSWEEAITHCENLSLAGHNDWRMPSFKELYSLVNFSKYDPAVDTQYFPNPGGSVWRLESKPELLSTRYVPPWSCFFHLRPDKCRQLPSSHRIQADNGQGAPGNRCPGLAQGGYETSARYPDHIAVSADGSKVGFNVKLNNYNDRHIYVMNDDTLCWVKKPVLLQKQYRYKGELRSKQVLKTPDQKPISFEPIAKIPTITSGIAGKYPKGRRDRSNTNLPKREWCYLKTGFRKKRFGY